MADRDRTGTPRQLAVVVATVVAFVIIAAACGGKTSSDAGNTASTQPGEQGTLVDEGQPTTGGKVVWGLTAETNGWNPAKAQWADAGNLAGSSMLEPLAVFDADGNVHPWLAESWSSNAKHDTWTLRTRQGISFHDGTPFNAEAVAASLRFNLEPGTLSAVALGSQIKSVTATDASTVQIVLNVPWAVFDTVFAGSSGIVMSPSMLALPDNGLANPIGTGAFKFKSWTPDESLQVTRFDGYWGGPCALPNADDATKSFCQQIGLGDRKVGPYLDAMEFRPIPDSQQRANALQSGDLNVIMTNRAADTARLRGDFTIVTDYKDEQTFVMLNTSTAPFDNPHARQALAYATNRQAIVDQISSGEPVSSDTSPFETGSRWGLPADQTGYPSYDLDRARQEVAAYKADTGKDLSFSFSGLANVEDITIMQLLQEQWSQAGVNAKVDTLEQTAYISGIASGNFQAAYFRNYGYSNPDSDYYFWSRSTAKGSGAISINFTQYWSDVTEKALDTERTTTDFDTRKAAIDQLVRDRNQAVNELWLFNTPYAIVADQRIGGLNPFRAVPFGAYLPKPWVSGLWRS